MEKETTENKGIYLREINIPDLVSKLKKGWKYYLISLPLTFIVSAFIIFSCLLYCKILLYDNIFVAYYIVLLPLHFLFYPQFEDWINKVESVVFCFFNNVLFL